LTKVLLYVNLNLFLYKYNKSLVPVLSYHNFSSRLTIVSEYNINNDLKKIMICDFTEIYIIAPLYGTWNI